MEPLSQGLLGASTSQSFAGNPGKQRLAMLVGFLAGMAPDLDVFIRSANDPLLFLEFHRQFTHSLFFIPAGALLCTLVLARPRKPHSSPHFADFLYLTKNQPVKL